MERMFFVTIAKRCVLFDTYEVIMLEVEEMVIIFSFPRVLHVDVWGTFYFVAQKAE